MAAQVQRGGLFLSWGAAGAIFLAVCGAGAFTFKGLSTVADRTNTLALRAGELVENVRQLNKGLDRLDTRMGNLEMIVAGHATAIAVLQSQLGVRPPVVTASSPTARER